jgi:hypothetical protein
MMRCLPTTAPPDVGRSAEARDRRRLKRPPRDRLVEQERYIVSNAEGPRVFEGDLHPAAALCVLMAESLEREAGSMTPVSGNVIRASSM